MRRTIRVIFAGLLPAALLAGTGPASATHKVVTEVNGKAFGYFASISLFGGPPSVRGPSPTVTLPSDGADGAVTASEKEGLVQIGPAIVWSSGQIDVRTRGTIGPSGFVATDTSIQDINTSEQEVFTATSAASKCKASESGISGSTKIVDGVLQTSEGNPDVEGDETFVNIPENPPPNLTINGTIESVGDSFQYIFNEQIVQGDGSLMVHSGHLRLLGPTAVGDLFFGQSVCGVTMITPDVDTASPKVVRTVPASGASGVSPSANVRASFSEPMRARSVNGETFKLFRQGSSNPVAASVTYDGTTRKGILNPTNSLRRGVTYKAVVTTFARDPSGNRLDQSATQSGLQKKVWTFTIQS